MQDQPTPQKVFMPSKSTPGNEAKTNDASASRSRARAAINRRASEDVLRGAFETYRDEANKSGRELDVMLRDMLGAVQQRSDAYLDLLLESTERLEASVAESIAEEMSEKLDLEVRRVLTNVFFSTKSTSFHPTRNANASSSPSRRQWQIHQHDSVCDAVPMACSYKVLEKDFRALVSGEPGIDVYDFAASVLRNPDLRSEIEPSLAMLVAYAKAQTGTTWCVCILRVIIKSSRTTGGTSCPSTTPRARARRDRPLLVRRRRRRRSSTVSP